MAQEQFSSPRLYPAALPAQPNIRNWQPQPGASARADNPEQTGLRAQYADSSELQRMAAEASAVPPNEAPPPAALSPAMQLDLAAPAQPMSVPAAPVVVSTPQVTTPPQTQYLDTPNQTPPASVVSAPSAVAPEDATQPAYSAPASRVVAPVNPTVIPVASTNPSSSSAPASASQPPARVAQVPTAAQSAANDAAWEKYEKAGESAFYDARYGDAERAFNKAMCVAVHFGEADMRMAKTLGEQGKLLTVRGRFPEAETLLEEELHVKELAMGEDNTDLIPDMASLCEFYLNHGTAAKAEPLAKRLLALVEGTLPDHAASKQSSISLKKGQPLVGWAGTAAVAMRDPLIEWAISCDALGDTFRAHELYPTAERLYKAALDVKTTVLGNKHLSLANSYDSLGTLCADREEFADAESFYKDSLDMTANILGAGSTQGYGRLDKLAKVLVKENKFDEAEKLYIRAQDFWKNSQSPAKLGAEARAMYALGNLYADEKRYTEAAPILQRALQLAEEYNGSDSIALVPYLQRYAYVLYYLGQKDENGLLKARADAIAGIGVMQ